MSTINERVKLIRTSAELNAKEKMTLERFGARIGVQKSAVSKIEKGIVGVSEQMFLSICREFDVNPEWLRDGVGEMFIAKNRNDEIEDFFNRVLGDDPDEFRPRLIAALARLDDSEWDRVAAFAQAIVAGKDPEQVERELMHAELDRQLDLEKEESEASSAS